MPLAADMEARSKLPESGGPPETLAHKNAEKEYNYNNILQNIATDYNATRGTAIYSDSSIAPQTRIYWPDNAVKELGKINITVEELPLILKYHNSANALAVADSHPPEQVAAAIYEQIYNELIEEANTQKMYLEYAESVKQSLPEHATSPETYKNIQKEINQIRKEEQVLRQEAENILDSKIRSK